MTIYRKNLMINVENNTSEETVIDKNGEVKNIIIRNEEPNQIHSEVQKKLRRA